MRSVLLQATVLAAVAFFHSPGAGAAVQDPVVHGTGSSTIGLKACNHLDVCRNSVNGEFLLVYVSAVPHLGGSFDMSSLIAQRIDGNSGLAVAAPVTLAGGVYGPIVDVAVAHVVEDNRYAVAYSTVFASGMDGTDYHHLELQILASTAQEIGIGPVHVDDGGGGGTVDQREADLTSDGSNFLIVWRRTKSGDLDQRSDIRIRGYSPSGIAQGFSWPVENSSADAVHPSIVTLEGTEPAHLVVYAQGADAASPRAIKARLFLSPSDPVGGAVTLSASAGNHDWPRAAANAADDEWMVVWERNSHPGSWAGGPPVTSSDILGRRITAGMALPGVETVLIGDGTVYVSPTVAWSAVAGEYQAIWRAGSYVYETQGLQGVRLAGGEDLALSAVGTAPDGNANAITPMTAVDPVSGRILAAWMDYSPEDQAFDYMTLLLPLGAPGGEDDGGGGTAPGPSPEAGGDEGGGGSGCGGGSSGAAFLTAFAGLALAGGTIRR